jgi:hypothetical protein
MKSAAASYHLRSRPAARLAGPIALAVRNSLNLPRLRVEARRGPERGAWQVRLQQGQERSEWLTLNAAAVAVIKKVSLLPPKLLGQFRLAYDAIRASDSGITVQNSK